MPVASHHHSQSNEPNTLCSSLSQLDHLSATRSMSLGTFPWQGWPQSSPSPINISQPSPINVESAPHPPPLPHSLPC